MGSETAVAETEQLEDEYEELVSKTAEDVEAQVPEGGTVGLTEVVNQVHGATGASPSVIREALTKVLYSGKVALTEDRQLVRPLPTD